MTKELDVLYIHPGHKFIDYFIPTGLIGLLNGLNCAKKGILPKSIDKELIRRAKIIVMDVHWYYNLFTASQLSSSIKKINPQAKIILGGYTASILAEALLKKFEIDFVVRGDADGCLPKLVECLLGQGESLEEVPNVIGQGFKSQKRYALSQKDYNEADCLTLDWFEDFKSTVAEFQRIYAQHKRTVVGNLPVFPIIPVFKGCRYDCDWCYGSKTLQQQICGRGQVIRSPEYIKQDLERCQKDKDIHRINVLADFFDAFPRRTVEEILGGGYDLDLYYDFYNLPKLEDIKLLLRSFKFKYLAFCLSNHGQNKKFDDLTGLLPLLKFLKGRKDCYVYAYAAMDSKKDLMIAGYLKKFYDVDVRNNYFWNLPIPMPSEDRQEVEAQLERFLELSRKETEPALTEFIKEKLGK